MIQRNGRLDGKRSAAAVIEKRPAPHQGMERAYAELPFYVMREAAAGGMGGRNDNRKPGCCNSRHQNCVD